ncbi:MAG: aminopeptidase [Treponema sp.]|jgi:predicted aminopeptidase|nr:aminopeptidase [Treponema sp.]
MKPSFPGFCFFPTAAAAILLIAACIFFSGCYTLRQGTSMLGYLGRAVPLEHLAGDSASEENRRFARQVEDIRHFAMKELGLRESRNYTRYVELDRSYLAAVVSASAKDSFTRHEWRFPLVGAMPYKGFFNVEDARKERAKLEKRDLDVWVRGVDAFSTLGWFRDPLYSYMRDYSPGRLADLIIHELTHATVFIKGQVQFNEELAEFVGSEGARLYMESRFGADSEEYRTMIDGEADNRVYVAFIRELAAELELLYRSGADREEKLREKARIIKEAQARFTAEYESRFSSENYRGFAELPVNNAYLELYRLYYAEDNYFSGLYERSGGDLPKFVAATAALNKSRAARRNPRVEMERFLGSGQ